VGEPFLLVFAIPMFRPQYNLLIILAMTRAFWQYPICRGPLDQSGLGYGHATTQAQQTLQLATYELQYVLQYILKKNANKQLILVILLLFSVALAQNTTDVTTATTMAAAGGNCPLAPHMRPCAPHQHFEWMDDNPPSLRMYFWGVGLRVCMVVLSKEHSKD
jgi:hypothetical protein